MKRIVVDSSASLYALDGIDFAAVPLKIVTDEREYLDLRLMLDHRVVKADFIEGIILIKQVLIRATISRGSSIS